MRCQAIPHVVSLCVLLALASVTTADESAKEVRGKVLSPDGKPVAGAEVVLTQEDNARAQPVAPADKRNKDTLSTRSADDGAFAFTLPERGARCAIGVAHEAGYGEATEVTFPKDGAIRLTPWGRVKGVAMRAGKPLAGVKVFTEPLIRFGRPWVNFGTSVKTGPDGRFAFDRVPAGFVSILVQDSEERELFGRYVEVEAGKTARVEFGGDKAARTVVGRINLEPAGEIVFDKHLFQANGVMTRPPLPDFYDNPSDREDPHGRAYENQMAFLQTAEGKAQFLNMLGVAFTVKPDGSFRIDDVPPGEYDLRVYLERRDGQPVPAGVAIGEPGPQLEAEHVITVPEGPADQPVDLGVLEPGNSQRPGL